MILKNKIQFYKLFQIKQTVIKGACTKYEEKTNWMIALRICSGRRENWEEKRRTKKDHQHQT